ncbi:MAG: AAA family ATPase [Erysipelotrichaceae bacterium]|nr:AAA family ATPase [Erysipelotrichaceae bacterium]
MKARYKYPYTDIDDDSTSQYDDLVLLPGVPVKARYIHAAAEEDAGNPLIEALPRPRISSEDIRNAYTIPIYDYQFDPDKSKLQAFSEIGLLEALRFPLPYHQRLEQDNNRVLLSAYRLKELMTSDDNTIAVGYANDMAPIGYCLIGASGSGKSSSLKILLNHCPQVIMHDIPSVGTFYQIVYLVVNAVPNSNFKALYREIARAIDRALGYTEPFYEKMIKPNMSLGNAAVLISKLLEKFCVGELFVDEIQLMSFNESKENSYQTLAVLSNETKTALIAVGTEGAVNKMFNQQWTARRIGPSITSDRYCASKEFFSLIVARLSAYQWGRERGTFSDEAISILYQKTNGIIAYLIMLYERIQMDIVQNEPEDAYTPAQIERISNLYFDGIERLMTKNAKKKQKSAAAIKKEDTESKLIQENIQTDLDQAIQAEQLSQMIADAGQSADIEGIKKDVVERIKEITDDYNTDTIVNAFNVVLKATLRKNETPTLKQMLRKTLERLASGKTDLRPKAHKPTAEQVAQMKSDLRI